MQGDETMLRIGEVSRRTGVSPELLRAWERRYGLLRPVRSPGGLRLYSTDDVERVRVMRLHLAEGLAAAEAAALAARRPPAGEPGSLGPHGSLQADLAAAIERFDEPGAQAVLDQLLALSTVDALLASVVLPYLHELGEGWERGEVSVAQEHFASSVLRGRLLGLARGWGRGVGPAVLLACLPGEQHDLGLIAFGLALRARGWRIGYLGADTPLESLDGAARALAPALVALSTVTSERVAPAAAGLRALAGGDRVVALGGAGATDDLEADLGVLPLTGDPVSEADRVSALLVRTGRA